MAKTQTFIDKASKGKKQDFIVKCPDTGKDTKVLNVRLVEAVKTDKGTYKFIDKNAKVYESTYKEYKA